ncbi:MAG: NTP transferase domain-containing protein [Maricaulaceae bacterium]
MMHKNWGGVLMMGGRGQRMGGRDKSALTLKDSTFRDIALNRLENSFDHVAISVGQSEIDAPNSEQFTDITIDGKSIGPAGGLLAAFAWAENLGLSGIVTLPVDTPILPTTICDMLCVSGKACYGQHSEQAHWLHAAWPLPDFENIKHHILTHKIHSVRGLHSAINSHPVLINDKTSGSFMNINTVDDYKSLKTVPTRD